VRQQRDGPATKKPHAAGFSDTRLSYRQMLALAHRPIESIADSSTLVRPKISG